MSLELCETRSQEDSTAPCCPQQTTRIFIIQKCPQQKFTACLYRHVAALCEISLQRLDRTRVDNIVTPLGILLYRLWLYSVFGISVCNNWLQYLTIHWYIIDLYKYFLDLLFTLYCMIRYFNSNHGFNVFYSKNL